MEKKKFNVKKLILFIILLIVIIFIILGGVLMFLTMPTGDKTDIVDFEVKEGSTYYSIVPELKEEDLIKSEFVFKLLIKLKNPENLDAGIFALHKGMNASQIIDKLSERNTDNPDAVVVTIPEGKHITDIADILANNTSTTSEEYLNFWSSEEFLNKVIEEYWFIDESVKKEGIRYPLEGYFFPSTYEFQNKDVTPEEVALKLLSQMESVLESYKADIESSSYSAHEILTMASIIEYEAILDEDRALISGIFYKRMNDGMLLQSCATVGYAIDEWKLSYSADDLAVDSPYNTYVYSGLPIGPANCPSEESIKAAIYPEESNYYYFMADVCTENPKTYFSETIEEHNQKIEEYLTCF